MDFRHRTRWIDEDELRELLVPSRVAYPRPEDGYTKFTFVPVLEVACLSRDGEDRSTDVDAVEAVAAATRAAGSAEDEPTLPSGAVAPAGVSSIVFSWDVRGVRRSGPGFSYGTVGLLRDRVTTLNECIAVVEQRLAELR